MPQKREMASPFEPVLRLTGVRIAISVTHNPLSLSILAKYPAFRAMQDTSLTNCVSALCMSHNSETSFCELHRNRRDIWQEEK